MNKVIEIICRILPNDVKVTVPDVDKTALYTVTGITNIDGETPIVVTKKDSNATFNVPVNLIGEIRVVNLK